MIELCSLTVNTKKKKDIILKIIGEQGFEANEEKIHLCRSKGKHIVTGPSIAGEKLLAPRNYKRRLRQDVHYIMEYGYLSQAKYRRIKDPFFLASIYGKVPTQVEPDAGPIGG